MGPGRNRLNDNAAASNIAAFNQDGVERTSAAELDRQCKLFKYDLGAL